MMIWIIIIIKLYKYSIFHDLINFYYRKIEIMSLQNMLDCDISS